tara:strand:- start:641 stop:886 length:246 start_codon:yes stop_codon:yes gene_type:complete
MAYINSAHYSLVQSAISIATSNKQEELIVLAQRHTVANRDITAVTDHGIVVDNDKVFIELEYEYYNDHDVCMIDTALVPVQ